MKLFDDMEMIHKVTQSLFNIELTDEYYRQGREEIIHVFLHETCHAVAAGCVPWIFYLPEETHTVVDEILARLIERQVAEMMNIPSHTADEQVEELAMYGITISNRQYVHLMGKWQYELGPKRDVEGMARYIIEYLEMEKQNGVTDKAVPE